MGVKRLLVEEFENELKELEKTELGTEQHKVMVDSVTKLADRIIEIDKHEQEAYDRETARINESSFKAMQLTDEKRDRWIKNGLTAVSTVGGLGLAFAAFVMSMNFEKEGTLTTEGGRTALRHLLKFK